MSHVCTLKLHNELFDLKEINWQHLTSRVHFERFLHVAQEPVRIEMLAEDLERNSIKGEPQDGCGP